MKSWIEIDSKEIIKAKKASSPAAPVDYTKVDKA